MANGAAIRVKGLDKTLRALKVIDPEAMKALRKGFREVANPILDKTKRHTPMRPLSGYGDWSESRGRGRNLDWDPGKVRTGMRAQVQVTRRQGRMRLVSNNPAAAIFENAGSKNDQAQTNPRYVNQSRAFNRGINARFGEAPRLLVRTWKQEKGIKQTYTAVGKLIADATERVNRAMR